MSYVWHLLSCWPCCSWCQWMITTSVLRDTSSGSWTLSTRVCATQWRHMCLLVSAGTDTVHQLPSGMFFLVPLTLPLQPQEAGPQKPTWEHLPTPALLSSHDSHLQMHPVSFLLSFVLSLCPTGVWPTPKTHSSLHYCHVSTLLGSRNYDIH